MTVVDHALAPPPTPNCNRIDDGYNAIQTFLEHLADRGLVIVPHTDLHRVIHKAVQAEVLLAFRMGQSSFTQVEQKLEEERIASQVSVDRPDPQKLLDELYGIDQRELEKERRALIQYSSRLAVQAKVQDALAKER